MKIAFKATTEEDIVSDSDSEGLPPVMNQPSDPIYTGSQKIEKFQEYQCKECYFYFSNERTHTCEKYKSILFKITEQKEIEG